MKSPYLRFFSVLVCASFLFVFGGSCFAPLVYADTIEDMNKTDWAYMYVDSHLGVDVSNIPVTYYGQTLGNYLATQTENSQTALYNAIQTAGQAVQTGDYATGLQNEVSNAYSYAYSNIYNTVVTDANIAQYTAQKTARTISDGAKTLWDVSGSNFFNSVYNKLFTNGGYKDQYAYVSNGGFNGVTGNGTKWSMELVSTSTVLCKLEGYPNNSGFFTTNVYNSYTSSSDSNDYRCLIKVSCTKGNNTWVGYTSAFQGWVTYSNLFIHNVTYNNNNINYFVTGTPSSSWGNSNPQSAFFSININGVGNIEENNTSILQPNQVGIIFLNGVKTPVYTDTSKNDFTVNPNGTVTTPNGDILPIYIDPTELSPEGDIILLNYYISLPDVTNNLNIYGQPLPNINLKDNNNQISFTIDGLLDTLVDAILKALEQFFKEPAEDTAEETEEDAQKEYEFIENPFGIISDIWAGFMGVFGFS